MNLSRRSLFVGAGTLAVASQLPAPAIARNIKAEYLQGVGAWWGHRLSAYPGDGRTMEAKVGLSLTMRLLDQHEDAIDLSRVVIAPQDVFDARNVQGRQVMVRNRRLGVRLTLEVAIDGPIPEVPAHEDGELLAAMADELASELRGDAEMYARMGAAVCRYVPVMPHVVVDPDTFEPVLACMHSYGLTDL